MSSMFSSAPVDATADELHDIVRFRVAPSNAMPKKIFVNCHYCGYSPAGNIPVGGVCPKCLGSSWERFALSRRLIPEYMQ